MKKVVSIFAVMVMSIGLFSSCESDKNLNETDAVYDLQVDAGDGDHIEGDQRGS